MTSKAQDGRREIQAVVRVAHHTRWYARSCQHPGRMRGNAEETPVITAGIREAHIAATLAVGY